MIIYSLATCFAMVTLANGYLIVSQPYLYQTAWYNEMPIDHFSYSDERIFSLRFLYNDTWYKRGGPIFFYTGNEGDITTFANNTVNCCILQAKLGSYLKVNL